ncbi:HEPN domain-containing protein [Burkholderia cepacia]|uniref:ApeA N-terminal domain 1-containing protein n=1 Tax=Burkholderia cepacia TaxID=292 RepID=UPI002FE1EE79
MKTSKKEKTHNSGTFNAPDGQEAFGQLHLNGHKTTLHLNIKRELSPFIDPITVTGELGDRRKVSCLECILGSTGSGYRENSTAYYYAELLPHFIAIGNQHLNPSEKSITSIKFTTQDISSTFHDFGTFGHVTNSKSAISTLKSSGNFDKDITLGEFPELFYYSGKSEVISVQTRLGDFNVSHHPTFSLGGANGKFIKNQMAVTIKFEQPITFDDCIERTMSFHRFLSLIAGRQQSIRSIFLEIDKKHDESNSQLALHWMFAPRQKKDTDNAPHPGDIPLDAVGRPTEFSSVLRNWLDREPEWRTARVRYAGCLAKGNSYNINRLVAAANMFDILPDDATPPSSSLSPELAKAQNDCREIFKKLPPGVERDSILGALGRINKPSLTKKVLHRVSILNNEFTNQFPDLSTVAIIAIKARNFFVHGSLNGINYNDLEPLLPFLTDALEFIFASSDLIEAGWDAKAWGNKHYGTNHSFTRFRWGYLAHLTHLKETLS